MFYSLNNTSKKDVIAPMPLVPNEGEDDESAAHRVEDQAEIQAIKISSTLLDKELQCQRIASSGSKTRVCYLLTATPNSLKIYLLVLQKSSSATERYRTGNESLNSY